MNITPLFKQYLQLKQKAKDAILLFRVGDFYETYFEDAKIFSEVNSVVLTKRTLPDGRTVPMAGVPFHAVDNYIKNLLTAGYKIAIAEQLEEPSNKGNIVKRDIVEIITPGTITSYNYLDEKSFNFLTAIHYANRVFHVLSADISVLEGFVSIVEPSRLINVISYFNPSEVLISSDFPELYKNQLINYRCSVIQNRKYSYEELVRYIIDNNSLFLLERNQMFDVFSLLLSYLEKNIILKPESSIKFRLRKFDDDVIFLDAATIKNLDLVGKNSLAEILGNTSTVFGSRKFKVFITQPLKNRQKIHQRLEAVEYFYNNTDLILDLRTILKKLPDIERILSKFSIYRYSLNDLISCKRFFEVLEELVQKISMIKNTPELIKNILQSIQDSFSSLTELRQMLLNCIDDQIREFQHVDLVIKEGFNHTMDEFIYILKNNDKWLRDYEDELRRRTGIKSLKISYNQVFGYYIEVTKANAKLVPSYFERKQTLVNAERYVTPEIKEFEANLEKAVSTINQLQQELLRYIVSSINENRIHIINLVENISLLDIILALSYAAVINNYVKPEIVEEKVIYMKEARHPVYEKFFEFFVPNDVNITPEKFFIILTGPNMGGKSTYIKTVAINTLMAHIGSFIPCSYAKIGLIDGLYTRIGSSDEIIRNKSTFMVEMLEAAYILDNCTENSLIVMDEIGRGTSTYDGMAIAWAICEYLSTKVKCRSILATHFHQLANLEKVNSNIANYHVKVLEADDRVEFTYKVVKGAAEKSYGIFVAKIAGVKPEVIKIADQVLRNFEKITGIKKVQTKFI
ncbi:MAG: DNA mismatch repair protein MutS [bacterium]